jgi:drug/metabolite transporter (DMT)-like permease
MVWFPLALGAALLWSAGGVLVKKGFTAVSPLWNNILNNLLALLIWAPAALLLSRFRVPLPPWWILLVILGAALIYQFFYYSLSKGQLSLTGTIIAAYPMFTILLAHLFLGERLAAWQYGGVALILAGGVVVALPERVQAGAIRDLSWLLWGLLGAFSLGTGDFLSKLSVNRIGSFAHLFYLSIIFNLASPLNFLVDSGNRSAPRVLSRAFLPSFLGIIIHLFGAQCFIVAFGYGPASLVSSVSSIYPALVVLLSVRFLKERIAWRQGLGIGFIVAGLIVVGLAG